MALTTVTFEKQHGSEAKGDFGRVYLRTGHTRFTQDMQALQACFTCSQN